MSGPWYQDSGPDADYVRTQVENYIRVTEKNPNMDILTKYIDRIIPFTRNDFGSWRGYASFRMTPRLSNQIRDLYDKEINALRIIKTKFVPFVMHHLYKPKSVIVESASERYYINQNILNKKSV
tara:strand:- start:157 stop:528 length:372 start_codon:yes stop_codon:yes gene_type:complete